MMNCTRCGGDNRIGANFCRHCGQYLDTTCPKCGTTLAETSIFCDQCGFQVSPMPATGGLWSSAWMQPGQAAPRQPEGAAQSRENLPPPTQAGEGALPEETGASQRSKPVLAAQPAAGQEKPLASGRALRDYIPEDLASKLEEARESRSMSGERRVVTMLFCDVKGSTALAKQFDPEEWTEIINGAFEHMIGPVYKYEGIVARLMGDALLAFFGAPIAHEDDPERAVMAGLEIVSSIKPYQERVRQRYQVDLDVRVGINTGMVVVGAVGSDLRMEYTAMGDAINLAAKMEQTAEPGTVRVAHETYRLVAPLFEFEALEGVAIKGIEHPVPAFRALRRKAEPGRLRGIEGLDSELVGREQEMASLAGLLRDVRQGVGRVVCLTGEAGLGKSRLLLEARKMLEAAHDGGNAAKSGGANGNVPIWLETASLSYESAQPYALFRRLLRRSDAIGRDDDPDAIRRKLTQSVAALATDQRRRAASMLETMFGLQGADGQAPLEGESFRRAVFELMPELCRQRFGGRPAILVFEDIHWSDPASIALLERLLPLVEEMPLVLMFVLRPDRRSAGWQIRQVSEESFRHRFLEISLRPLTDRESEDMIDSLLGKPDIPASLRAQILERANGIPFFIEEIIRVLIEDGVLVPAEQSNGRVRWWASGTNADIHIPGNLQSLMTARIDGLSDNVRQTLQLASVIGRSFYRRVLEAIRGDGTHLDDDLHTLMRQEMIRESARLPEVQYSFRNLLAQEAAYRTILHRSRRDFHRRVGQATEAIFSGRVEELAPQLAYHFREAEEFGRALHYYRLLGDEAYRLFANAEAVTQYTQALEMVRRLEMSDCDEECLPSELLVHLFRRRGRALEHLVAHKEAQENYEEMRAMAVRRDDAPLQLAAMMAQATLLSMRTSIQSRVQSEALSREALILAEKLDDQEAEARIYWNLMNAVAIAGGDLEKGLAYGEASLQIARRLDLREQIAYTLTSQVMIYHASDRILEAGPVIEEITALWRELDNQPMLADAYANAAFTHMMLGNYDAFWDLATQTIELSRAIDNTWNLLGGLGVLAHTRLAVGEFGEFRRMVEEAIALAALADFTSQKLFGMALLADGWDAMSADRHALGLAEALVEQLGNVAWIDKPIVCSIAGRVIANYDDPERGRSFLEEQLAGFDLDGVPLWIASFAISAKVELALREQDAARALDLLEPALLRARQGGIRSVLPQLCTLLARSQLVTGRAEEAKEALREGLNASMGTGERRWRWQILKLLSELEEGEQSEAWRQEATGIVNAIADSAGDREVARNFLERSGLG